MESQKIRFCPVQFEISALEQLLASNSSSAKYPCISSWLNHFNSYIDFVFCILYFVFCIQRFCSAVVAGYNSSVEGTATVVDHLHSSDFVLCISYFVFCILYFATALWCCISVFLQFRKIAKSCFILENSLSSIASTRTLKVFEEANKSE